MLPFIILAVLILFPSCGGDVPKGEIDGSMRSFGIENIFLGKNENDELIVEAHFRSQHFQGDKLILKMMFLPSENFEFEEEYRGFSRIIYYKLKKKTRLTLGAREDTFDLKLKKSHIARSIEPFDVDFEQKETLTFLPDYIDSMAFLFKGVVRWERVTKENVGKWSKTKEAVRKEAERRQEVRKRRQEAEKKGEKYDDTEGVWVSVNSTYLYEKKDVVSNILAKIPLGTFLERSKPAGGGWYEIVYGDSSLTGYIPEIMLTRTREEASAWEEKMSVIPVETPLEPEQDTPDSTVQGIAEQDITVPDTTVQGITGQDITVPDTTVQDIVEPDTTVPDTTVIDE